MRITMCCRSKVLIFLLIFFSAYAHAQTMLRGTVKDSDGQALPGASVVEKGTSNVTIAGSDGSYSISLKSGQATLVVSFIGYNPMEQLVNNRSAIDFVLSPEKSTLDQVVVVGYGKLSSKDVSNSITSLSEKDFNRGAVTSVAQMVQGRVAGVYSSKDGNPNSDASLIIRGTSTLRPNAQDPLYVIDGVPSGGIVAPEDIVSIDILKDASATAIYGSRAANGVIMITTRQGKAAESSYATFNAYTNVETVAKRYEMMDASEYRNYLESNGGAIEPGWDDGVDTDWQKDVMRTAVTQNYYLNFGGRSDKSKYDASVNYIDEPGIIKSTGRTKLLARLSGEQTLLNNRLTLGVNMNISRIDRDQLYSDSYLYRSMLTFVPTTNAKDANGNFKENIDNRDYNPIALMEQNTKNQQEKTMFGSGHLRFKITQDLDYNAILSYQSTQYTTNIYNYKETSVREARGNNGRAIRNAYENSNKIFENYLSYNKTLGKHNFGLMTGYSWQEDKTGDGFQASNIGFVSDATTYLNLGLGSPPDGYNVDYGTTTVRTLRMISFYGRATYNYDQRYILQASLREDGSSAFGANNRWGLFPSVSGAWRVIEEEFMKQQNFFNDLKLKAGFGISGNSLGFDPMTPILRYGSTGKFYYNGNYINSFGPVQNENPNLKWEKTSMMNLGLEMAMFKSALRVGVEYYNKLTSDLIWDYDVSSNQYLYSKLTANVGKIRNKGVELTVTALPIRSRDFNWTSTVTLSHNKNTVESLSNEAFKLDYVRTGGFATGAGQSGGSTQIIKEGLPLGTFYTLRFMGYNDKGQSQFLDKDGNITESPSAPDDYYVVGDAQPKLNYGWVNDFSYKNFNLGFMFRGVAGHKVLNATMAKLNYTSRVSHYNMPKYVLESNQPFNDIRSHFTSDRYIENADYLRLESLWLGYTFNLKNNLAKYVKSINLYGNIENLFCITGYKGIDPDVNMSGIEPGIDADNMYPRTRSFQLGVKINF